MSSENEKNDQAVAEADDARAPTGGGSPLDAEPSVRARRTGGKRVRRVKEYEEDVSPNGAGATDGEGPAARHFAEQHPPRPDEASEFESDSPLDAMADAALEMAEVDRIGPGEGQGWVGRQYDFGDGRGPQPVGYGRAGSFPDDHTIVERVQATIGGGQVRFVRRGKKPVVMVLGGPPLPLPSEAAAPRPAFDPFAGDPRGYDGFGPTAPADPFDDPNYDPTVGVDPQEVAQTGLNGWYRGGPYNRLLYYVDGVPSRPPRGVRPPRELLGGAAAAFGGYDPAAFDHSERGDDRLARLEKLVEKLAEAPREDPRLARLEAALSAKQGNDVFTTMMANQLQMQQLAIAEAAKQRDHEYKLAQLKAAADEAERKARIATDAAAAEKLKALELEAVKAKADADKETARHNAEAMKENAKASIASNERMAQIQSEANKQVIAAVTSAHKNNDAQLLKDGMELAANVMGGKSTVSEISNAAKDIIPSIVDGVVAVRTMNAGQQPASNGGGTSEDEMLSRMTVLLAKLCINQAPPAMAISSIGGACDVSGYDVSKIDPLISIGTPTTVAALLDVQAQKATDEGNKKRFLEAKALLLTDAGKRWFDELKKAYLAKRSGKPMGAPQVGAAPSAGQIAGPGPSTPKA